MGMSGSAPETMAERVAQLGRVAEGRRSDDAAALDVDIWPVVAIEEHYGIGTEALQTVDEGGDGAEALADLHDDGDGDAAAHVFQNRAVVPEHFAAVGMDVGV